MIRTSAALVCLVCDTELIHVPVGVKAICGGCTMMFKHFEKCMSADGPRVPKVFSLRIPVLRLEERLPSGVFKESYKTHAIIADEIVVH